MNRGPGSAPKRTFPAPNRLWRADCSYSAAKLLEAEMSERQKRNLVLIVVVALGTLGVLAFLGNSYLTPGGSGSGEPRAGVAVKPGSGRSGDDKMRPRQSDEKIQYLENAPWMAPGIPMVQRLSMIQEDRSRLFKFWTQREAVAGMRDALAKETDPEKKVAFLVKIAAAQLQDGQTEEGIGTLRTAADVAKAAGIPDGSKASQLLLWWFGIGYLRQGEQDNCLGNHNADSCLLPIKGGGVYKITRGPEGAIKAYTEFLKHEPDHLGAMWLLNLAYMTTGRWPQDVPKQFLVPPESFKADYDIGRFVNIAPALGLDTVTISGGAILEDFDKDGFIDLVKSAMSPTDQVLYFHNDGNGKFTNQTVQVGLTGEFGGLNMVQADYNNDGYVDIYITRGAWQMRNGKHPDSLLRNNGPDPKTGVISFTDVTEAAGLLAFYPSQTAAWGDFNSDGWLDLFVGSEAPQNVSDYPSLLFQSNGPDPKTGQVSFKEIGQQAGITSRSYVKGSG